DTVGHTGTSLRDAISLAVLEAGSGAPVTITFAPGLDGSTITLAQGTLLLSAGIAFLSGAVPGLITIDGGGRVTVSANHAGSAFEVATETRANLTGLTITAGNGLGGGILNRGTLTVDHDVFTGNTSSSSGGAIYSSFTGTLTVTACTFTSNTAS